MFNARKKKYVDNGGPVRYLNGKGLARPIDMPKPALIVMGFFVAAGVIIGAYLLYTIIDEVYNSAAHAQATVEENLSRPVTLDLPILSSLMPLDDATILQSFTDSGFVTYNLSSAEEANPNGGFDVLKLPSDVSVEQAGLMYLSAGGFGGLSASDASLLMNGSWRMTVNRDDYTDMKVRYADFASGSAEAAIQNALVSEGLDTSTLGEAGIDSSGNTFQSGNIDIDGTVYSWRVSAISLSSVYSIKNLPDTAVYVGIRMTT